MIKPQYVVEKLYELSEGKGIISTEVGQNQMWAAQFYPFTRPRQWISSGGLGTMGFGFPAAMGVKAASPEKISINFTGDGSILMNIQELMTAVEKKLPVINIILNNNYLGMVRQWQTLFYDDRKSGVDLEGSPDFAKLAGAYEGALGITLKRAGDIDMVLKRAMEHTEGPCVINCMVEKTDNVFPMVPAGQPLEAMLIKEPKTTKGLQKPSGST